MTIIMEHSTVLSSRRFYRLGNVAAFGMPLRASAHRDLPRARAEQDCFNQEINDT
ncbi:MULTISPECIES: hypothetical protein [unclassified Enterococcus]|uniref:hypothetical protein n=1 Tax=unclassified Enterococcus TaxID=2608891 RepID=UPI0015534FA8|nr:MULTISPECIES: hypothetical protein [unclassified Enterococcus]MBS7576562.1 hypothetical protein [Enterococcus sp. MMGLQ5-2]MBS7583951.1 hypothetical protein [Enterococcus sp. MMGLQ5-1]NPD11812.1 hypothetical protein [Enterococcus sp. MMGLQ5-1]NPD36399.1 hypothetical protein [Enterococcus sp. MMGLQ5-2]